MGSLLWLIHTACLPFACSLTEADRTTSTFLWSTIDGFVPFFVAFSGAEDVSGGVWAGALHLEFSFR